MDPKEPSDNEYCKASFDPKSGITTYTFEPPDMGIFNDIFRNFRKVDDVVKKDNVVRFSDYKKT